MDINQILMVIPEYVVPLAVLAAFAICYVIRTITSRADRFIPLIAAVIGAVICVWASWRMSPDTVVAGLVSGLAATGLYEALKNLFFRDKEEAGE